ncbi:DEAD/DEAH box helicase [Flavobacterium muglaense]|uniref:DEAD/DEAH box helicase n=1 Tax=Flavobacterium muglaense TaxID=2764716 RepID=A0A923SH85_9FLAO|nr:DEAD/DEAH box helicase [Flavobacterium muglaense]MBC5838911.1 DEAD/DEAH box helicase [Flavobacterium muglaense]MBC5845414.1 DEAD/DEAH box helicase [Flavobacterium muglaense]
MTTVSKFPFCFDLSWDVKSNFFTPTAYVVPTNQPITYLDKKANPAVLKSFGIDVIHLDKSIQKAVAICESLQAEALAKKFNSAKAKKSLEELFKDPKVAIGIQLYQNLKLTEFLTLVQTHDFPICFSLDKDKDFRKSKISTQNQPLETKIHFLKTDESIQYQLQLQENKKPFDLAERAITILVDEPAWLIVDKNLVQLKAIDAKKLKPFLTKKTIEIPSRMMVEYFQKFIKDIVKKVDVTADGFEIIKRTTIVSCQLEAVHDFFKNSYYLNLRFDYNGYLFEGSKNKLTHSEIDLDDPENIKVIQYKRDQAAEIIFEQKLVHLGFEKTENGFFRLSPKLKSTELHDTIQWVIEHKDLLELEGFHLDHFTLDGKRIQTTKPVIAFSNQIQNDWFDIKITVSCGAFEFNFIEIIPNLKQQNQVYLLPDGSCFLIPKEWMMQYAPLAKLAKVQQEVLQLPKNNYAILQAIPELQLDLKPETAVPFTLSPLVKATLRPYQTQGVQWLLDHYQNGMGACLADDMGLGKTIQTLTTLVAVQEQLENQQREAEQLDLFGNTIPQAKEYLKVLVVLPSSLVFNWYNEARKFTPHLRRIQYIGKDRKLIAKKLMRYDLVFTSYAIATRDIAILEKHQFRFLILDESQYIKNKSSKIFKAINQIPAANKISLSGTPIENSLDDLWSQMEFINPDILGSHSSFVKNYKNPIEKNQDETALAELKTLISPFILRRTKEQVLDDLPELTEQIYYCEMEKDQEKLYEEEKSKARNSLLRTDGGKVDKINIINSLMRLRQLSNHPKMIDAKSDIDSGKFNAVTHYLSTLIQSKQKTIVFSSFVSNLGFYKEWCIENKIKFCELTGATDQKDREIAVTNFQEQDEILLFFISLKAGGVGLNITKASYVLFLDPWWNPFAEKQGIGRAHRIGQLNKVNVIRFISKNTVEEKIIRLQESKKLLSDSLLDENSISSEVETHLNYLLE